MTIYFTYELQNGSYQTLAAVDSVQEALHLCEGYKNWKIFAAIDDIPALLKGIREYKKLTQVEAAALLSNGYTKSTINNIESGRRDIGFKVLQHFSRAYNIDFGISVSSK